MVEVKNNILSLDFKDVTTETIINIDENIFDEMIQNVKYNYNIKLTLQIDEILQTVTSIYICTMLYNYIYDNRLKGKDNIIITKEEIIPSRNNGIEPIIGMCSNMTLSRMLSVEEYINLLIYIINRDKKYINDSYDKYIQGFDISLFDELNMLVRYKPVTNISIKGITSGLTSGEIEIKYNKDELLFLNNIISEIYNFIKENEYDYLILKGNENDKKE